MFVINQIYAWSSDNRSEANAEISSPLYHARNFDRIRHTLTQETNCRQSAWLSLYTCAGIWRLDRSKRLIPWMSTLQSSSGDALLHHNWQSYCFPHELQGKKCLFKAVWIIHTTVWVLYSFGQLPSEQDLPHDVKLSVATFQGSNPKH